MKHLKKIVSLLLTAVMVLAMCIPVMADDAETYTITAPNNNHTYEIYQIFTGVLKNDILSNVKWGKNGSGTEKEDVDENILTELQNAKGADGATNVTKLAVIEHYVNLNSEAYGTVKNGKLTGVPAGYYLIKDKDGELQGKYDTYTKYIVAVANNLTITPKAEKPTSQKKVKDVNDSNGNATEWQDSADYDIGDKVPFQLTGKVANDYDNYTVYKFVFHDKESQGLTFDPETVEVNVDGKPIATSSYTVVTKPTDNDTFDIVFENLKNISDVKAGSTITVEYKSELNERAIIGSVGNPNEMHLEYSNNPNDAQGGETGKTPADKVIVFTYQTVVNKVDNNNSPLPGAEFKLEKFVKSDNGKDTYQKNKGDWVERTLTANTDKNIFTAIGLDDGYYRLTETKAPDTYNQIKNPIYFEISATHSEEADDPILLTFTGDKATGETSTDASFSADKSKGSISTTVVNKKGSSLPETGGIGTTIFYVVGVILMLGAGVLLVTKKRMSSNR